MKLNRNDVCHCGSGKKYKKCHLEEDEARVRERRSLATLAQWVAFHGAGLRTAVREAARQAEPVQAALAGLGGDDPLTSPIGEQIGLFDVVVGERPLIASAESVDDLSGQRQDALRQALAQSWLSLHEVIECKPGKGVRLRDRLLERDRWVGDPELARTLEPMEVVLGRVVAFDKRNVLLEGFEKVWFRGRKAAIADLAALLAEAVAADPAASVSPADEADVAVAAPVAAPVVEAEEIEDEEAGEADAEGADDADAEEAADHTRAAAGEASPLVQTARVRWLKANAVQVVQRARAARP